MITANQINLVEALLNDAGRYNPAGIRDFLANAKRLHCESEHKGSCRGELWKCPGCGNVFCQIEGGTDNELCDTCSAEQ